MQRAPRGMVSQERLKSARYALCLVLPWALLSLCIQWTPGRAGEKGKWQEAFEQRVAQVRAQGQPVTFEEFLERRAIECSSRPGENAFDPIAGSGSTLTACQQMAGPAFLMEIDALYGDVVDQTWEQFTGQQPRRIAPEGAPLCRRLRSSSSSLAL